jgi:hypothetical protein
VVEATAAGLALAKKVNTDLHAWEDSLGVSGSDRRVLAESLARLTDLIGADADAAEPAGV